jgi:cytoskeletal protein CcmA (bactofilin family)
MHEIAEDANITRNLDGDTAVLRGARLTLRGQVQGDLTFESGARANVFGMVTGNVIVQPHGHAQIYGTVTGDVRNAGYITVYGKIVGHAYETTAETRSSTGRAKSGSLTCHLGGGHPRLPPP